MQSVANQSLVSFSLIYGKIQGKLEKWERFGQFTVKKYCKYIGLVVDFPKLANREIFQRNREINSSNREVAERSREPQFCMVYVVFRGEIMERISTARGALFPRKLATISYIKTVSSSLCSTYANPECSASMVSRVSLQRTFPSRKGWIAFTSAT